MSLWMAIQPDVVEVRLMLTESQVGTQLRARLPIPCSPRALAMLLESLAAWYGQPFTAALDAESQEVERHPERWAQLLGGLDERQIVVEWIGHARHDERERFFRPLGDFRRAKRVVSIAATGQK
jgi:hypothetical protein